MYFDDDTEATSWLPFDASEQECERYSWLYPDTFEEWRQRRDRALIHEQEGGTFSPMTGKRRRNQIPSGGEPKIEFSAFLRFLDWDTYVQIHPFGADLAACSETNS